MITKPVPQLNETQQQPVYQKMDQWSSLGLIRENPRADGFAVWAWVIRSYSCANFTNKAAKEMKKHYRWWDQRGKTCGWNLTGFCQNIKNEAEKLGYPF
jgi:hypothetical protein